MEIRDFQESDVPAIAEMILTTWEMDSYGDEIAMPSSELYLRHCVFRSDIALTAVEGERVMGCAMASLGSSGLRRIGQLPALYRLWRAVRRMPGYDDLSSDLEIIDSGDDLLKRHSGVDTDCELVLLIVAEDCRGKGVGGTLFSRIRDELSAIGRRDLLIFTDDDCGYTFYDRLGCTLLGSTDVRLASEDLRMMAYHLQLSNDNL